jgi:predicted DNA-binding transcriptional regulator AlpA
VADAFEVTQRAIEKWTKRRKFPKPFYIGRVPYWRGQTLLNWMENRQSEVA